MEIDQFDAAESALRQAVRMNDNYIPAYLWLANVLGQTGRIGEQKRNRDSNSRMQRIVFTCLSKPLQ